MSIFQGNAQTSLLVLRIIGLLGVFIGIFAHFLMWSDIDAGGGKHVINTGLEGYGLMGIGILVVFALLLLLNSVYAIVILLLFVPYMLEQIIGVNLLRYMPLSSTKLGAGLYLYLPMGFIFALIGSFAPIFSQLSKKSS